MDIKYDTPIQVSEKEYGILMNAFREIICGRKDENGNYWIKLWLMRYKEHLANAIKKLRS